MARLRFDLVALGEPLVEFNQVRPDEATAYRQGFGGDTSNTVIAASRLGARTAYVTRLGDDAFGRMFLELWRRESVDSGGVGTDPDAPTGIYFVSHGARGHEFSYLRAGSAASRMRPDDLPLDVLEASAVLHISGISQAISASACDTVFAAIDAARSAGARVSYDSNLRLKLWPLARARAVITATLSLCDWFVPSLEEAAQLSGAQDPMAILDEIQRLVPGYDVSRMNLLAGNDQHTTLSSSGKPTSQNPELIAPANDDLFSSGTLGRYSKTLNSVLENTHKQFAETVVAAD